MVFEIRSCCIGLHLPFQRFRYHGKEKSLGLPVYVHCQTDQIVCRIRPGSCRNTAPPAHGWSRREGSPLYSEGPGSRRRRVSGSRRGPFGTRSYALYRKSGPGSFPESSSPARRSLSMGFIWIWPEGLFKKIGFITTSLFRWEC